MSYRVVAPLAIVPDEDGALHYHYAGAEIESIDSDAAARLVKDGLLEKVKASRAPAGKAPAKKTDKPPAKTDSAATTPATDAELPLFTAPDEDWIVYAVTQGVSEEEARALGKTELIAKFAQQ